MSAASKKSDATSADDPVAPVFMLLAELLSKEIDSSLLGLLRLPEVSGVLGQAAPEAAVILDADWDAARFEEHAIEFCRLFIYPAVCAPRPDRWAKDCEEEQFSIRRWFDEEAPMPECTSHIAELPDTHIAKILVVRAGLSGAEEELVATYDAQMIHPWAAFFAKALEEQSQLPIYRATATMLRALAEKPEAQ